MSKSHLADPDRQRDRAARIRALIGEGPDLVSVVTPDLTILHQSSAGERLLGATAAELRSAKFGELVHPEDLPGLRAACAEAADGIAARPVTLRLRRRDGSWLDGETLVRYVAAEQALVLSTRDVGVRARSERRHRLHFARQALVVALGGRALAGEDLLELTRSAASGLLSALEADHVTVLRYEARAVSLLATASAAGRGHSPVPEPTPDPRTQAGAALRSPEPVIVRDWAREGRFREAPELVAEGFSSSIVAAIPGSDDEPYGLIVVHSRAAGRFGFDEAVFLQAVTNTLAATRRRVEYEAQIRHYALHDAVTDLPNRTLFEDRVSRALASAVRRGRRVGVLFLDLDSFKLVCEGLCHASGDELLRGFAQRVGGCLRAEDTLARVGSDEFGVLLPELGREDDVMHVVHRIQNALRTPLEVRGREIVTSAAIGIALSQGAGQQETAGTLLRDADLAMYAAKADGPGSWRFYAEHMHESAVRQLELTSDLYQTLERGELEVHFQPIVSLDDEAIVGTEALVRWNHPRHGLLSPGIFLPIAEETGLIVPLGRFVLRTACATLAGWQASGLAARTVSVSVNLGRQQLLATDLTADVRAALADTGLDPACLILEITEDVLLNREVMIERLRELKALGLRLAVDDFGTGYSALSHLQRYPIDIIKIDKAFVDDIGESEDQTRLIQGIIELTHSLGLKTVAEGIETHGQAEALRTMGSELGQGFHFARPLPTRDLEALLAMPACSLSELELTIELGHQP